MTNKHDTLQVYIVIVVGKAWGGGGTHMLRHTWMCRPNGLVFHQKSLDKGPILVKKKSEEGPVSPKLQKNKPFFEAETIKNGSQFTKIKKKKC